MAAMSSNDDIYAIELVDSKNGNVRTFYLTEGLSENELKGLIAASFSSDSATCVGLRDDKNDVIYPLSLLLMQPKAFHGTKLSLIVSLPTTNSNRSRANIGMDSQDTLVTEDHVFRVFKLLDRNNDGQIRREECIFVLTQVFEHLFNVDDGISFAYSSLTSSELANYTTQKAFAVDETVYLDYSDFSAWYMSGGNDPTKVLMIHAMQRFEMSRGSISSKFTSKTANRKYKSFQISQIGASYDDKAISSFALLSQRLLNLTPDRFSKFVTQFEISKRKSMNIDVSEVNTLLEIFLDDTIKYSQQTDVQRIVGRLTTTIIDILSLDDDDNDEKVSLGQLVSLLVLTTHPKPDLQTFNMIFQMYQKPSSIQFAREEVLYTHLLVVVKMIFHFYEEFEVALQCSAQNVTHAVFIKLIMAVEKTRTQRTGVLLQHEFVELFVHGLRFIVIQLQITHGFVFNLLANLIGTVDTTTAEKSTVDNDISLKVIDGEQKPLFVSSPATGASLEDDQISSYLVGYNGSAVSVNEARDILGLNEYESYDVVKFVMQLANVAAESPSTDGKIDTVTFSRGILKLLGESYVNLSVLQRSVVDFILDRITSTFATENDGFDMLEVSIALLLFCDDDSATNTKRSEIILALLKPKVLRFSTVRAVVLILFQMAYSLNPALTADEIANEAKTDCHELCMSYYMKQVSSGNAMKENAVFSHRHFLDLLTLVFAFLEEETEQRRSLALEKSIHNGNTNDKDNGGKEEEEGDEEESVMQLKTFSEDEASEGYAVYLNDKEYPPSPTVLELRAACSVLGLELYSADDLIDKLGAVATHGKIDRQGWGIWLNSVFQQAEVSDYDIDLAIFIGYRIFDAFQHDDHGMIKFAHVAAGLAFLCGKSPLEDRIMVAFTLSDENSDGFITFHELCMLVKAVLTIISVCSKMIENQISSLDGVTIAELSKETALQGIAALGLSEDDELNLEMLSDLAEDYLKLASFV